MQYNRLPWCIYSNWNITPFAKTTPSPFLPPQFLHNYHWVFCFFKFNIWLHMLVRSFTIYPVCVLFTYYNVLQVIQAVINKMNKNYFFYKTEKEFIIYAYHILNIHLFVDGS